MQRFRLAFGYCGFACTSFALHMSGDSVFDLVVLVSAPTTLSGVSAPEVPKYKPQSAFATS